MNNKIEKTLGILTVIAAISSANMAQAGGFPGGHVSGGGGSISIGGGGFNIKIPLPKIPKITPPGNHRPPKGKNPCPCGW